MAKLQFVVTLAFGALAQARLGESNASNQSRPEVPDSLPSRAPMNFTQELATRLSLLAAKSMAGYGHHATTTRYGDTGASACGSVSTAELVSGTHYYNVASAQAMWGGHCCWCGKSGGGGGTTGLGCFSCAKGRFLKHGGHGFASEEIHIVVGDLCPHAGNERWCPEKPGRVNSVGSHNHLDFSRPPPGIDNNVFVFTPTSCSSELRQRYERLSKHGCHP